MRKLVLCAAALAGALVLIGAPGPAGAAGSEAESSLLPVGSSYLLPAIKRWRGETWHWQRLMGKRRTPSAFGSGDWRKPAYRRWVLALWKQRAARWRRQAQRPPHLRQWLCIHRYERHPRQGWGTNTGNGFYGGLQMNRAFMRNYGAWLLRRKGTADRWRPIEQIWVAERGRRTQGWYAWPNTARFCGLI